MVSTVNKDKSGNDQTTTGWKSGWWYVLLLIPFLVYLKGLAPSIVFGDSGDYLSAGWIWGVAHPPGYPLFTILTGIFERLPIPPTWIQTDSFSLQAWRGNFLSMLFGVATLGVLFALVNRITGNKIAALISSASLAFSYVFWWHSEICENDTMSAFLLISMLLLAVRWVQENRSYDPYLLAFAIGTGAAHHHVLIMFVLPVAVYLFVNKALKFSATQAAMFILVLLIGFAPLFYLPITNYKIPGKELIFTEELDPGRIDEIRSDVTDSYRLTDSSRGEYFRNYILRQVYSQQRQYTHSDEALGENFTTTGDVDLFYSSLVIDDFGPILGLLGLIGFAGGIFMLLRHVLVKKNNEDLSDLHGWALISIGWLIYFLLVNFFPSGDILRAPRYNLETAGPGLMLPLEVLWAVFIGLGTAQIYKFVTDRYKKKSAVSIIMAIALIVFVLINAAGNYPRADMSSHTIAHEYAMNVMDSCPENSILVTAGDEMYVFRYMRFVHTDPSDSGAGYRKDIRIVPWSGMLSEMRELADISSAMTNAMVRLIDENPETEIGTTFANSAFFENDIISDRLIARRGLVFAFIPEWENPDLHPVDSSLTGQSGLDMYDEDALDNYTWDFWTDPSNAGLVKYPYLWPPEEEVRWRIGETLLFYGTQELVSGNTHRAREHFDLLITLEPWSSEAKDYFEYASGSD